MKTLNSKRPHPPATALPNRTRWLALFTTMSLCLAACAGDESEPAASPSTDSPAILTAYLGVLDPPGGKPPYGFKSRPGH